MPPSTRTSSAAKEVPRPSASESFQDLLLHLSRFAAQGCEFEELIAHFCRETRSYLGASGAYYWRVSAGERLIAAGADGHMADRFCTARLDLNDSAVAVTAVRDRRVCYVNNLNPAKYPMAAQFKAQALMAAPVTVFAEVIGVVVFLHTSEATFFNDDLAAKVTILAAQLGSLVELARLRQVAREHTGEMQRLLDSSAEDRRRAEDLMNLALELNSSLRLPDFVRSFVARAVRLLSARAGALALAQGSLLEVVAFHDPVREPDRPQVRSLNVALTETIAKRPGVLQTVPADKLLGPELAAQFGWHQVSLAQLTGGSEEEFLGLLCLADCEAMDQHLLQAVIGQATVALENARLFSRIAQSNRHWMEIFDAMEDLMLVHDESNHVLRVNRAMAESIGARPSELIGMSMRALVSFSMARGSHGCPFCRRGSDAADEYVHPVLARTYLVSTSRIHGALEEGLQTIHVLKDISERREAERRYRELFDNIQEGLYFSTPDGRFVEVNDALVRMLRYASRDELLQVNIERDIYFQAEQRQRFKLIIEQEGVLRNFEETLRRKDGSLMHTLQNTFAVRDSSGKVVQYRGLILDITEQKKFQAQLQRERDFNSKILNNTQSLILVADTAGLVTYGNRRCFEAGVFRERELLGRRLIDFVQSSRRHALEEAFEATLHAHQVNNLELPFMCADDRIAHLSVNLSPMRDEQGNVSSVVAVMTDITDALMIQAKLMHTEKMAAIGQLVSGVAHEVNNPLTAIMGFADLLHSNNDLPESARQELGIIMQEAERTKLIVQNLLSFARKMPPQREPLELNEIVRRTLQLRAYDFSRHGVDLVEELAPSIPAIMGDPHQLQQVVLNIINNAYDAVRESGKPGRIVVSTAAGEGCVRVSVRDSGVGISHPERIFDPFFTTKEVGKGTGLGLSICYGIVREHGGEVLCQNNEQGPGATFTVRLPMLSAEIAAAGADS